jgi:hypothetical protein
METDESAFWVVGLEPDQSAQGIVLLWTCPADGAVDRYLVGSGHPDPGEGLRDGLVNSFAQRFECY